MPMDPFQAFLVQRRSELRRIARMTHGEHTPEDVENEAWLIADRIAPAPLRPHFDGRHDYLSGSLVPCLPFAGLVLPLDE